MVESNERCMDLLVNQNHMIIAKDKDGKEKTKKF